jgi:dienelactone hydrolase
MRHRPRPRTILATGAAAVLGCLALLVLLAALVGRSPPAWVPVPVQALAFDVRLAVGPPTKKMVTLTRMPLRDTRVYFDRLGRYRAAADLGLPVPATLYPPTSAGPGPGILLLHGSTPEGRKMGLYRFLGGMLADRGYTVLSIDHGSTGDAAVGLRALASLEEVAAGGLSIVGHSAGAAVALGLGIADDDVARIVAIGPGVRIEDRAATEGAYFQRRELRYRLEPRVEDPDTFPPRRSIEVTTGYFSHPDHKPLLLVQGEQEDPNDRAFLGRLHSGMAGPATLLTVAGADHYMNVLNAGPLVVYDRGAAELLLDGLVAWLPPGSATACGTADQPCDWPGVALILVLALAAGAIGLGALGLTLLFLRQRRRSTVSGAGPASADDPGRNTSQRSAAGLRAGEPGARTRDRAWPSRS